MQEVCAVLDVGKSNTKLSLVTSDGRVLEAESIATPQLGVGRNAFDVDHIFDWTCTRLGDMATRHAVTRIIPVAHGAACAFLDAKMQLARPVRDYEQPIAPAISADYAKFRPAFAETFSPDLPQGLNLARQIYACAREDADAFAKIRWIVPYAQYFAWRFSGVLVSERTSLGCHTDLWRPEANAFSSLVRAMGWTHLFPELADAWEEIGTVRGDIAHAIGLPKTCVVHAGVHDTNAALFPYISQKNAANTAILSTGTWFVAMAPGGELGQLDPDRDCLANVDVFGRPVPCARFMGGREHYVLCGGSPAPEAADFSRLLDGAVFALPSFTQSGGPFPGRSGNVVPAARATFARGALASAYLALMSDVCLDLAGADGPVVVEGPAAKDAHFLKVLAGLRGAPVSRSSEANGVTLGAGALAFWPKTRPAAPRTEIFEPFDRNATRAYRTHWQALIAQTSVESPAP